MSKAVIKGVFYKKEKNDYHFIISEIYNNSGDSHTGKLLIDFDKKNSNTLEKNMSKFTDFTEVQSYKPIYQDKCLNKKTITNFKAKSKKEQSFIVGLEYQLDVYLNTYNFPDAKNSSKQINGWYIRIISAKEITKI
jgi:hypothetical protein